MKQMLVNYVDAPPGVGKTLACIECMRRHILAGAAGKSVGYIFYVAPTTDLLAQTISGLSKRISEQLRDQYIRVVKSVGGKTRGQDRTENQVYNILEGRSPNSLTTSAFEPGSILFLTHPTFLKLKRHEKFRDTIVFFDESRKWMEQQNIKMAAPGVKNLFDKLFVVKPVEEYSGINELEARPISENAKGKLVSTKASANEFTVLDNLHTALSKK